MLLLIIKDFSKPLTNILLTQISLESATVDATQMYSNLPAVRVSTVDSVVVKWSRTIIEVSQTNHSITQEQRCLMSQIAR